MVIRSAAFVGVPTPGVIDQDAPHRLCRGSVEVSPSLEGHLLKPRQAKVGLMNQVGGLQRVVGTFVTQQVARQAPQLVVHDRQQLFQCLGVAIVPSIEQGRDISHGRADSSKISSACRQVS